VTFFLWSKCQAPRPTDWWLTPTLVERTLPDDLQD
jgi:hypothetical protein